MIDPSTQIRGMKQGETLTLDGSVDYAIASQLLLTVKGVTIDFGGAHVTAPRAHDCFTFLADGIVVRNAICNKANIFAHIQANDCRLENCAVQNVLNLVKVEPNAKNFVAQNCSGWSNSVTFYGEEPFTLLNCGGRSVGEYAIRWEFPKKSGCLIDGGTFTNASNAFGKDTIGCRQGNGTIRNVFVTGNIRVGQQNQPSSVGPGAFSTVAITGCTFTGQTKDHSYINVYQGADVYESGNTFIGGEEAPVTVNPGGRVTEGDPSTWKISNPATEIPTLPVISGSTGSAVHVKVTPTPSPLMPKNSPVTTTVTPRNPILPATSTGQAAGGTAPNHIAGPDVSQAPAASPLMAVGAPVTTGPQPQPAMVKGTPPPAIMANGDGQSLPANPTPETYGLHVWKQAVIVQNIAHPGKVIWWDGKMWILALGVGLVFWMATK